MSSTPKKLQKLRTFRGDMDAARGGDVPKEVPAAVTSVTPRVDLPPVLNQKTKDVILPPLKKPEPSVTPATEKPIVTTSISTTSLQDNITAVLGGEKTKSLTPPPPPKETAPEPLIKAPKPVLPPPVVQKEPVSVMEAGDNTDLGGTVITNQKRGRFKILPSMWQAVKQWFADTERALERRAEKKRQAIPTVRTLEERKATVKKAASVGALAPKDDYSKLAKKLPSEAKNVPTPKSPIVTIADKKAVPEPAWNHFEGDTLRPMVEEKPAMPPVMKPVVAEVPKVTPPPPPPKPVPPPPKPVPPPIPEPPPVTPPPIAPPTPPPQKRPAVEPVKLDIGRAAPTPKPIQPSRSNSRPRGFRWLFFVGVATTAVVATIGGAAMVNWIVGGEGSGPGTPVVNNELPNTVTTPLRQDNVVRVTLPQGRQNWYANLREVPPNGLVTIVPVINIGGATMDATGANVMATLAWNVEPTFIRSVEEITFASYESQPVILIKVTAFDAAFGGLLLSENELSTELSPLFGEPVTSTYIVGRGTVPPEFVDELAENHDVRVLRDELENERIVYGFTDQNTLIIAPNKEAFTAIVERLR